MQSAFIILSLLIGATVVLAGPFGGYGQQRPGFPSNGGNNTQGNFSRPSGPHNFTGVPSDGNFTRGPHGNFTGIPPNGNNTSGGRPGGSPPRRQRSIESRGNGTGGFGGRPHGSRNITGVPSERNFTGVPPNGNNTSGGRPGGSPPRRQRSIESRGNGTGHFGGRPEGGFRPFDGNMTRPTDLPFANFTGMPPMGGPRGEGHRGGSGNFTGTPPVRDDQTPFGNVTLSPGSDNDHRPFNNGNRPSGQRG